MNRTPVLQIRHRNGGSWLVAATWPDGTSEEILGFKTNEWIAKEFQAWLDDLEKRSVPMPEKHPDTRRIGGAGASHENRKNPKKSKPDGELNRRHPEQENIKRTAQGGAAETGEEHS
jgi:hypothetical protein